VERVPKIIDGAKREEVKNRTGENCVKGSVFQDTDKWRKLANPVATCVLQKRREISSLAMELFNII